MGLKKVLCSRDTYTGGDPKPEEAGIQARAKRGKGLGLSRHDNTLAGGRGRGRGRGSGPLQDQGRARDEARGVGCWARARRDDSCLPACPSRVPCAFHARQPHYWAASTALAASWSSQPLPPRGVSGKMAFRVKLCRSLAAVPHWAPATSGIQRGIIRARARLDASTTSGPSPRHSQHPYVAMFPGTRFAH